MKTVFLFCALEPTHGQNDVYITKILQINFETPKDFQSQVNDIESTLRISEGSPAYYQFKTSASFNSTTDCNKERVKQVKDYKSRGLKVNEVKRNTSEIKSMNWYFQKYSEYYKGINEDNLLIGNQLFFNRQDDWTSIAAYGFQLCTGFDLPFLGSDNGPTAFDQLNQRFALKRPTTKPNRRRKSEN